MTETIASIVRDFEADLLASVQANAGEAKLQSLSDQAFDRLHAVKEEMRNSGQLEAFFDIALDIEAKLKMALKAIKA